ncbi:MAG TPA: hypothetical protein VF529_00905 [Solirubrobacteraceae bacterium]|jgi:hypothetical protein
MAGEINGSGYPGGRFKEASAKAVASAIQNYAWYHRQHARSAGGAADVDNTTDVQCFKPGRTVSRSFRRSLVDVEDERLRQSDGSIQLTEYRDGEYACDQGRWTPPGRQPPAAARRQGTR